ncbi:large-conductance mechanosensitive channel protein MscL [Rhodococcus sp. AG1013]|uniref:large-conductance mechanosensitive channel protein MscL n=1 Tax=unclassified Rhodococcus (in: high G+C Gram-positive bacteria) TaxID=192944 RepID=UPI000E0C3F1A|nr:large-conductance mechanosensitive channel protein MscL [Rhodococcus sp. AG1013]RDI35667.1 large conductance mechanosensitive channel [Rhodococcus sp. AG1013]
MLKGFKDFLLRGNVLDLAVAVVVGAAFTAIVTAFTNNIINPLVAAVGGSDELGWGREIIPGNDATFVDVGAVVTAIINFVIIAAVVYFVLIVPANAVKARFATEKEDTKASEADLLIQIRDILAEGRIGEAADSIDPDGKHSRVPE